MNARLVVATYRRWNDATGLETPVALVGHVAQDAGHACSSELCVVWHDATIADMDRLGFDAEERAGAVEAMSERFWANEAEAIRVASARQREIKAPTEAVVDLFAALRGAIAGGKQRRTSRRAV